MLRVHNVAHSVFYIVSFKKTYLYSINIIIIKNIDIIIIIYNNYRSRFYTLDFRNASFIHLSVYLLTNLSCIPSM